MSALVQLSGLECQHARWTGGEGLQEAIVFLTVAHGSVSRALDPNAVHGCLGNLMSTSPLQSRPSGAHLELLLGLTERSLRCPQCRGTPL
ncbi:unnamed protein product [Gadus morhua 'NCC']